MRVLVLGVGYVGLPLGAEMARQGHEVVGVRRSPGGERELQAAGIQPRVADVAHAESLTKLTGLFDWVVNCVSSAGGGAEEYRRVYLQGARNLVEWLMAAPPRKFVYTSSTGVYAQNDGSLVEETAPVEPTTETGRILVETEKVLLEAARQRDFPAVILRVAGIYGPGRGHYLKQFLGNEARIEGNGDRFLNMIHRDDVVGAILAALRRGKAGEIYNGVDSEPARQAAYFHWLAGRLGKPPPPSVPADPDAARKRGVTNKQVSNRKLRTELGYQFKYPSFREGFSAEIRRLHEGGEPAR